MVERRITRQHIVVAIAVVSALALVVVARLASLDGADVASANPMAGVASVAAGEDNTCFLFDDSSVKCAGGGFGSVPAVVNGLAEPVTAIGTAGQQMCALTSAGGVKCWTSNNTAPIDVPGHTSGIAAISVNAHYSCALTTAGAVSCWGTGGQGQLADGVLTSDVISVSAGYDHACALLTGGGVKCWGRNDAGQLGDGTTLDNSNPVDVQGLSGATAVVAGLNHSCALVATGVKCWGQGYGMVPAAVPNLTTGAVAISSSFLHTCAVLASGGLKCWGDNVFGELGDGLNCGGQCANPATPDGLASGASQVSAGAYHSCARLTSGAAACWGINFLGQLGIGTVFNSTRPRTVVTTAAKPPPTPTPCPMAGCPTPTPTPSGPPLTGVDWHISVDVNGDGNDDCSTMGSGADDCAVAGGSSFQVRLSLDSLAQEVPEYVGFDSRMFYTGVQSKVNSTVSWPECDDPPTAYGPGWVAFGCNIFAGLYTDNYTGLMGATGFSCQSSGTITLTHGSGETSLYGQSFQTFYEGNPASETLSINCIDPIADDDGDSCPNGQELSSDQAAGGRRDPYNPWDYFNPTGDGLNRIDDILRVVQHYFQDNPSVSYATATDRTALGPNTWNLGPPDGQQRIADILDSVGQYFHDCG